MLSTAFVIDRRRKDVDRRDEVWRGTLRMRLPGSIPHQAIVVRLLFALRPLLERRGLQFLHAFAVRDPVVGWNDYRVPDIVVFHEANASNAAVEGRAETVVEVLEPNDESRNKFGFYAIRQVQEVWIVEPKTLVVEVYALRGDHYERIMPVNGVIRAPSLGIDLLLGDGALRIQDGEQIVDV